MGQFRNVLLVSDKVHTLPERALDCRPGLGGLNQVYWYQPTHSLCFRVYVVHISTSLPDVHIGISIIS